MFGLEESVDCVFVLGCTKEVVQPAVQHFPAHWETRVVRRKPMREAIERKGQSICERTGRDDFEKLGYIM